MGRGATREQTLGVKQGCDDGCLLSRIYICCMLLYLENWVWEKGVEFSPIRHGINLVMGFDFGEKRKVDESICLNSHVPD